MTPNELEQFLRKAFIAFPGLKDWAETLPKASDTLAVWSRTLERVTLDEATQVLNDWIDCTLSDPPVGYRRETFAIDIKSIVSRRRTEHLAETYSERAREEQWIKANRGKYQPSAAFRSIAKPFLEMLANKPLVMMGEMSHDEYDRQVDLITERAFK
ncbi:MAG: hypothetical protein ACOVQH_09490 [Burkholderiaceae bacterium]